MLRLGSTVLLFDHPAVAVEGCATDVRVGPRHQHGKFLTVQLMGSAAPRDRLMQQVAAKLDPLVAPSG
jgi:hypothetical protein